MVATPLGEIVQVNAGTEKLFGDVRAGKMFGYRAQEVLGQPLAMLMSPDIRERDQHSMARFGAGKQASRPMAERTQVEGLRRDGERLARETRPRESERRLRAVFEHAAQAIGLLDAQGTVLEINRSGRALTVGEAPASGVGGQAGVASAAQPATGTAGCRPSRCAISARASAWRPVLR